MSEASSAQVPTLVALVIFLTVSAAQATEAAWPKRSASDLSAFVTFQRYRLYADHCSARTPHLKPAFDGVIEKLDSRIQSIKSALLASETFKGMQDKPVPDEIILALRDIQEDVEHNFERQDAALVCPKTLQVLGEMDDTSLKSDLSQTFTAVQNMIRNVEKQGAR